MKGALMYYGQHQASSCTCSFKKNGQKGAGKKQLRQKILGDRCPDLISKKALQSQEAEINTKRKLHLGTSKTNC